VKLHILYYTMIGVIGVLILFVSAKELYVCTKLKDTRLSSTELMAYGSNLIRYYSLACEHYGIECDRLSFDFVVSDKHGAAIRLSPARFQWSRPIIWLAEIPRMNWIYWIIKPFRAFMAFIVSPFKVKIIHKPIEKFLWPHNEASMDYIQKSLKKKNKGLPLYYMEANLQIGDGKTSTYFAVDGIAIFGKGLVIDVKPKASFKIEDEAVIVYEDKMLVKGTNRIDDWRFADVDAYLLLFPKRKLPKSSYDKIVKYYEKMIEYKKVSKEYDKYLRVGDETMVFVLEARLLKLKKETTELLENL